MAFNISAEHSIEQVEPRDPLVARVTIKFKVQGDVPEDAIIQIYAQPASTSLTIPNLIDEIPVSNANHTQEISRTYSLQAAVPYYIGFCPRTLTDHVLDDRDENGAYWEGNCYFEGFTTQGLDPAKESRSHPYIESIVAIPATYRTKSRFRALLRSASKFDEFLVFVRSGNYTRQYQENFENSAEREYEAEAGWYRSYEFQIEGGTQQFWNGGDYTGWSTPLSAAAATPHTSVRQFFEINAPGRWTINPLMGNATSLRSVMGI